jgi:pimeloyl-ACP methyl ester carboxylesterase
VWVWAAAFAAGCAMPVRRWAPAALIVLSVAAAKTVQLPAVDAMLTARELARQVTADACAYEVPRSLRYGLHYYAGKPLGECWEMPGAQPVYSPGKLPPEALPGPRYAVRLEDKAARGPLSGWLLVFATQREGSGFVMPDEQDPNVVWLAARRVLDWRPGETILMDPQRMAFPGPIFNAGAGKWRFSAVLDTELDFAYGGLTPGDFVSAPVEMATFDPAASGRHEFVVDRRAPVAEPGRAEVRVRSALLSRFHRRGVFLEADIVAGTRPGRVIVLHGFGQSRAKSRLRKELLELAERPELIFVECAERFGYHAFADSDVNGPWGRAMVEELLPSLGGDGRFAVLGEDFGGWAAAYLRQRNPERFTRASAIAPDPLDFSRFFGVDLRGPLQNIYRGADGGRRPFTGAWSIEESAIRETVLGPQGGRWESWEAVFGLRTSEGISRQLFDRERGEVDDLVRRAWLRYDLAARGLPDGLAVFGRGEVAAALASLQSK